ADGVLGRHRKGQVGNVDAYEHQGITESLAREVASQRGEAVDVLALPGRARVGEQVLDVDRSVRMADEVDGTPAVLAVSLLDEVLAPLQEAVHVRRQSCVIARDSDVLVTRV